jgi:hypothetical protein
MPGEFYIEGKKEKVDLTEIKNLMVEIQTSLTMIGVGNLTPVSGTALENWEVNEQDVVTIGEHNSICKVHSLLLSINNLVGTVITVRMYMDINGGEQKVYEQPFDAATDPLGLWIINGTLGIHEALRVTLQSNHEDDNGQIVDYDYLVEGRP